MIDNKILQLNNEVYFIINGTQGGKSPTETNESLGKGREYLHFMYPNEFEYYACAFELTDSNGKVVDFFSFPVMPDTIEEVKYTTANIKETAAGVVINANARFKPFDIEITGDFGRRFRRLLRDSVSQNNANPVETEGVEKVRSVNMFDSDYKTGYGNTKAMEQLLIKSQKSDENYMPYKLFFHNFSLNSHYMTEVISLRLYQNKEKNMIWTYAIRLKAVAPADAVYSGNLKGRLEDLLGFKNINKKSDANAAQVKDVVEDENGYSNVKKLITEQAKTFAYNVLSNPRSALQIVKTIVNKPNDIYKFIVQQNSNNSILNRFK